MENKVVNQNPNIFYSREEKKVSGIFYTPSFLATYLSKKTIYYYDDINNLSKVLDPACGDSILLRNFISELQKEDTNHFPKIEGIDKDINAIANSNTKFRLSF